MGAGRRVAAASLVAGCVLSCASHPGSPLPQPGQFRGGNVLLVTIDTLRRDRLGAYGGSGGLTPTLDGLAASGVRYAHATSHAPLTLPAHTSILTGLSPRRHGVHNNVSFRLDDRVPTMATVLKGAGYRTGAFLGAFVLDRRFGLSRGFDVYDDRLPAAPEGSTSFRFPERRAGEVVRAAGDWILSSAAAPWFAWVHLYDPHAPYQAPPEYRPGRSAYDAEVAYTDAMLGALLGRLRAAHALDRTLIVVTADHGESLGEHGETTHGLFAYDATLAVPLIVAGAPIRAAVVDTAVAHADILPTVAALVGAPPPPNLDGRPLTSPVDGDRAIDFEALDAQLTRDWAPLTGIVQGAWKFIDLPLPELYDRRRDPGERDNLIDRDRSRADRMRHALSVGSVAFARPGSVDGDAAARLRALGYVGGTAASGSRVYRDADDPKRLAPLNERFNDALQAFNDGRHADALDAFHAILAARPDFITARTSAATVLLADGRAADAVRLLKEAPPAQTDSAELLAKLGAAERDAGNLPGAARALEAARAGGDANPDLLNDLGVVYARLGRASDARARFRALLEEAPNAAGTWYNLGLLEMTEHHGGDAVAAFRRAVAADPQYGEAWKALGAILAAQDPSAAADAWRRAEPLRPRDYDLLFNLGVILAEHGHGAEALPYLDRFAREAPPAQYAADIAHVRAIMARVQR